VTTEAVITLTLIAFVAGWCLLEHAGRFRRRLRRRLVYACIRANEGISASKIADKLNLTATEVHAHLRGLEDEARICTLPAEGRDRRCWTLSSKR